MIDDMKRMYEKYAFDKEEFTLSKLAFRMDLLEEEFNETKEAVRDSNSEEIVDGLIDLIVIAIGTLNLAGVDTQKAWDEVYRANMTKERGIKPGREQSGGFDIIKPDGWKGPDHSKNHGKLDTLFKQCEPIIINEKR